MNRAVVKRQDLCVRVGQQNRRVCGDQKLYFLVVLQQISKNSEHSDLPLRRQGGFRLIEYVKAFSAKSVFQKSKERLAMRPLMQADISVGSLYAQLVNLLSYIEKALCSQIEALAGSFGESNPKRRGKRRYTLHALGCLPVKTAAAALAPKAVGIGDGFDESGLA
jgi:hypothetical protein